MKRIGLLLIIGLLLSSPLVFGQEIYQWVDEKGTVHFTDDFSQIPGKYQDQVKKKKTPDEPTPSSSIKSPRDKARPAPDAADVEKKDILGRGEDWWRDKAMEWRKKRIRHRKT